jgi:hypothetical protein
VPISVESITLLVITGVMSVLQLISTEKWSENKSLLGLKEMLRSSEK